MLLKTCVYAIAFENYYYKNILMSHDFYFSNFFSCEKHLIKLVSVKSARYVSGLLLLLDATQHINSLVAQMVGAFTQPGP